MTYLHRGIRFLYRLLMPFKYPQNFLIIVYKSERFRAACSSLIFDLSSLKITSFIIMIFWHFNNLRTGRITAFYSVKLLASL